MKDIHIFAICNAVSFIVVAIFLGHINNYFFSGILFFISIFIIIIAIFGEIEEDE